MVDRFLGGRVSHHRGGADGDSTAYEDRALHGRQVPPRRLVCATGAQTRFVAASRIRRRIDRTRRLRWDDLGSVLAARVPPRLGDRAREIVRALAARPALASAVPDIAARRMVLRRPKGARTKVRGVDLASAWLVVRGSS